MKLEMEELNHELANVEQQVRTIVPLIFEQQDFA